MGYAIQNASAKVKAIVAAAVIGTLGLGYSYTQTGSKPAPAAEVATHQGEKKTVEIVVGSSLKSKNHALLNDGKFPNHTFTVRVMPDNPAFASISNGKDTAAGKRVIATGTVTSYNGKPQLQCGAGDKVEIR